MCNLQAVMEIRNGTRKNRVGTGRENKTQEAKMATSRDPLTRNEGEGHGGGTVGYLGKQWMGH